MITIPRSIYTNIIKHCEAQLPEEAFGLLIGYSDQTRIDDFIPLQNWAANRTDSFLASPQEWAHVYYSIVRDNKFIIGLLHSHPQTEPVPSQSDLNTLWYTIPSHWIISFLDRTSPALEAYSFDKSGTYQPISWIFTD
jgi:proteasome lid subunit RPN8/RPN11